MDIYEIKTFHDFMVFNERTVSTHAAAWKYHELIIVVVVAVVVHILFLVRTCPR